MSIVAPIVKPIVPGMVPGGGASGTPAVSYLLRGTGATKAFDDGTANYTETDGSIAVSGGVFGVTAQSTANWGDLGWVSNDINAVAGRGLIFTLNGSAIETTQLAAGWTNNGIALANVMNGIYIDGAGNVDTYVNGAAGPTALATVSNSADEKFALLKGGYNASGVPVDDAANIASYAYGASWFKYDGSNWELLYRTSDIQDTGQDYPAMSFYDYGGTYDYTIVPDVDLSSLLEPIFLDTFTDTNGTSLDAHTPDVGTGWTEVSGNWDIQGNAANPDSLQSIATTSTSYSDVFAELVGTTGTGGNQALGIIIRYTDVDNFWLYQAQEGTNVTIYERNAGGWTLRASAAPTISELTEYNLKVVADGATITGYLDDDDRISYGSASFQQTETIHGIRLNDDADTVDMLGIWPRGTGGEYSDLDNY